MYKKFRALKSLSAIGSLLTLKLIISAKNDRKVVIFGCLEGGAIIFSCYIYIGLYFCFKIYGFFPTSQKSMFGGIENHEYWYFFKYFLLHLMLNTYILVQLLIVYNFGFFK